MSAIVAGLIPKIEGFQPIPNAVMIPFMEVQSAALAYGFGLNYEFSKRKIRSMSNEEYNKLTPQDIEEMQARHTAVLLEGFIKRVPAVMPAQAEIFKQYVLIEKLKVEQNITLAKWMVQYAKETIDDATAHLLGGHIHPTNSVSPSNQPTYIDPNDTTKDFTPPTGSPAYDSTPKDTSNTSFQAHEQFHIRMFNAYKIQRKKELELVAYNKTHPGSDAHKNKLKLQLADLANSLHTIIKEHKRFFKDVFSYATPSYVKLTLAWHNKS